jgi:YD repeat-containing protein
MFSDRTDFNGLEAANEAIAWHGMKYLGHKEVPGPESNDFILTMIRTHRDGVFSWVRDDGELAYCSVWMELVAHDAGALVHPKTNERNTALALSWRHSGRLICERAPDGRLINFDKIIPGDILGFTRGRPGSGFGHVAIYCNNPGGGRLHVMGANQANRISTTDYALSRLLFAVRLYLPPGE